jgi:hypothetical protein
MHGKRRSLVLLVLSAFLSFLLLSGAVLAEDLQQRARPSSQIWYFGIGASQASIDSNYPAIGHKSAGGYALLAGLEFAGNWSVEMFVSSGHNITTGATENIYYPPDTAEYSMLALNLRLSIWSLEENWWTPWIGVGVSIGDVSWDTYFYGLTSGWTPAISGGVDVRLGNSPLAARTQALFQKFSAKDTYDYGPYNVSARVLSAMLVYRFR